MSSNKWFPPPRYIFRKFNLIYEVKKLHGIKTFLDAGCGAGDIACSLIKLGLTGEGIDFSEKAIEVANQRKKELLIQDNKIEFNVGDIKKLKKKYDLVLSLEVLEHIKDHEAAFKELVDHSTKYIIISVPAKKKLYSYSDKLVGHYRRYDMEDIIKLLNSRNIEIIKIISYGYPFTNILRYFRENRSKKLLETKRNKKKEVLSKDSGLNMIGIKSIFKNILNEHTLVPFIWISRLFNNFNLAEGYLVIGMIKGT